MQSVLVKIGGMVVWKIAQLLSDENDNIRGIARDILSEIGGETAKAIIDHFDFPKGNIKKVVYISNKQ